MNQKRSLLLCIPEDLKKENLKPIIGIVVVLFLCSYVFHSYMFLYLGVGLAVFYFYEFFYFRPIVSKFDSRLFFEARLFNLFVNCAYVYMGCVWDIKYGYSFHHAAYIPFLILMATVGVGARMLPVIKARLIGKRIIYQKSMTPERVVTIKKS